MERTLLLNSTFEPLKIISWQRAITLLTQGKVEVIDFYDREVRSVTITFRLPSILRLLKLAKIKRASREVRFSRPTSISAINTPVSIAAAGIQRKT